MAVTHSSSVEFGFAELSGAHKNWSYIRHELIYVLWAWIEVCLFVPLTLAILPNVNWSITQALICFFVVMVAPVYLVRIANYLEMSQRLQKRVLSGWALLSILCVVPFLNGTGLFAWDWVWDMMLSFNIADSTTNATRYLAGLGIAYLVWWRGIKLATLLPHYERFASVLRWGSLAGLPAMLLGVRYLSPTTSWSPLRFILIFFVLSILTMFLLRVERSERYQEETLAHVTPLWVVRVGVMSLIVIFLGWGIGVFISGDNLQGVARFFSPLWLALTFFLTTFYAILDFLFAPIWAVIGPILTNLYLQWRAIIFDALSKKEKDGSLLEVFDFSEQEALIEETEFVTTIEWSTFAFPIIVILLVTIVLVLLWLVRVEARKENGRFSRLRKQLTTHSISAPSEGLVTQLWRKLSSWERQAAASSIKRIYAHLVQYGAENGYPRHTDQTPYEHLPNLNCVWPNHTPELHHITQAYVKVRYGDYPETQQELNAILQAWETIQKAAPQKRETEEA